MLRAFFNFAVRSAWLPESPAAGLRPPKEDALPTLPLEQAEVQAMLRAARDYPKESALLITLRWTGLAIGDAVMLRKDAIRNRSLSLRRAKTGELVCVAVPEPMLAALSRIARPRSPYYFWTGRSKPQSVTGYWRKRLKKIADLAGVDGFHPHRLRDTFVVELLAAYVSMEDVSALVGHSSVKITEKYYAPWNRSRRDRLITVVEEVNQRDPLLCELTNQQKTGAGSPPPVPVNTARHADRKATRPRKNSIPQK